LLFLRCDRILNFSHLNNIKIKKVYNITFRIIAILLLFLFITELKAQIITDRPDQTESSSTVGGGNLQIESGMVTTFEGGAFEANRQVLAPTTLFRYGITKGVELRFVNQFETRKTRFQDKAVQGISDLEIGTKIQLFQKEGVNTEIALLSHLILPIGSEAFTNGSFGTVNKLSIAHDLSENMALGYNIGYNYFGTGKGDLTYSVALGVGVNDKVGVYIEPYGDLVEFKELVVNFDGGFTYLVNPNLQLDFSFGTSATEQMNYVSAGVSWLIHKN
jgi:hypothetical protein